MEMPIQLIITLFIALAVGSMILMFSGEMLNNASKDFIPNPDAKDEKLLEFDTVSGGQLAILVDNCYKKSNNEVFVNETCYIIHSKNSFNINGDLKNSSILSDIKEKVTVVEKNDTYSAGIYWIFTSQTVEVRP